MVFSLALSSPAHASLSPCYLDINTLKVVGMSYEYAQDMHDNPSAHTGIPWCDPLQGVYLGNLDLNGNGVIDALEPAPTPTPGQTVMPTPVLTKTAASALPAQSAQPVSRQAATPQPTDTPKVLSDTAQATVVATPTPMPSAKSVKLAAKSTTQPALLLIGLSAAALLAWYIIRRLVKK